MPNQPFASGKFKALLFDFDGTIADTMPGHLDAWNQALAVYDLSLSKQQHQEWAGIPTRQIVEILNNLHKTNISPDEFSRAKEVHYLNSISSVKPIIPVVEIIKSEFGKVPMAIVSGSRHKPVELTLAHLGLQKYFNALVCAEDYVYGKPAPDCFLKAADILQVAPQDCLVFEDAELGFQAARAAGMSCLMVSEDPQTGGHKIT